MVDASAWRGTGPPSSALGCGPLEHTQSWRDMSAEPAAAHISREEVAHLARLARLAVTDAELDVFAGQLEVILGAVARVGEVAADDIPPTSHSVPLQNVFRPDELRPGLTQEQALACAPAAEDGRFRVPQILGEEA